MTIKFLVKTEQYQRHRHSLHKAGFVCLTERKVHYLDNCFRNNALNILELSWCSFADRESIGLVVMLVERVVAIGRSVAFVFL